MFDNLKLKDRIAANATAVQKQANNNAGFHLEDNRTTSASIITQLNPKNKAKAPAKSAKAGKAAKQQSKEQRVLNNVQKYRPDFCSDNNITVAHISAYLKTGATLKGHGSGKSGDGENNATKEDIDRFVGWFRKRKQ
jgi:hypothetical protein